jgi:hypothetical protein
VLWSIVTRERRLDRLDAGVAALIAQERQDGGIALAGEG